MKPGKLSPALLSELLDGVELEDSRVVVGPRFGEDAAVIDLGDRCLVSTMDPVTFATDLIGWYLVQINANDVAVMGAAPKWMTATILMPPSCREEDVRQVFDQIHAACKEIGVTLVGGHTEITPSVHRAIAIGALQGEATRDRVVFSSGARPGDSILLTKAIAIEGTAILAREASDSLRENGVPAPVIEKAKSYLFSPGISVVDASLRACSVAKIHAMHDPTEGGLAGGLLEIATAADVGVLVDAKQIPILPECAVFCQALGLNPLGLIASGALIVALDRSDAPCLIEALEAEGIPVREIGLITLPAEGLKLKTADGVQDLPWFERDELARFFGE